MDRAAKAKRLTANNRLLILTNFPDIFVSIYLSTDSSVEAPGEAGKPEHQAFAA